MIAHLLGWVFTLLPPMALAAKTTDPASKNSWEGVPVRVQYLKTGREEAEVAERQGNDEVENSNPCVVKMKRDLESWSKRAEMKEALTAVKSTMPEFASVQPLLVLRYMNESMELRFEMRTRAVRDADGKVTIPEGMKYRRGVFISNKPGTWQERIHADQCHVSEENFNALVDEMREADRLEGCVQRKKELLEASRKITNYIHNYLPAKWLEEARQKLILQNTPVNGVLRVNDEIYRLGNSTYKECVRGLKLLEEEAGNSVRVLNEVKVSKQGTDVPATELDTLDRKLNNTGKK